MIDNHHARNDCNQTSIDRNQSVNDNDQKQKNCKQVPFESKQKASVCKQMDFDCKHFPFVSDFLDPFDPYRPFGRALGLVAGGFLRPFGGGRREARHRRFFPG